MKRKYRTKKQVRRTKNKSKRLKTRKYSRRRVSKRKTRRNRKKKGGAEGEACSLLGDACLSSHQEPEPEPEPEPHSMPLPPPEMDRGESSESESECPICLGEFQETVVTPCGHELCTLCLAASLTVKSTCPMCRAQFEPEFVAKVKQNAGLSTTHCRRCFGESRGNMATLHEWAVEHENAAEPTIGDRVSTCCNIYNPCCSAVHRCRRWDRHDCASCCRFGCALVACDVAATAAWTGAELLTDVITGDHDD